MKTIIMALALAAAAATTTEIPRSSIESFTPVLEQTEAQNRPRVRTPTACACVRG